MPMRADLASFLDRIRSLLEQRRVDPDKPPLTVLENTLTDGYARALQLEAEHLRLQRQIQTLAHDLDNAEQAEELRQLARQLSSSDDELAILRDLLVPLQEHVDAARAA